jgi:hypothetical protein
MKRLLSVFIVVFTALSVVNIYTHLMGIPHVLASSQLINDDATLTIQAKQTGAHISPILYGIMYEDISHAGDRGMYDELIRNRIFKNNPNIPVNWSLVTSSGAQSTMTLDNSHPVNNVALTTSLKLQITIAPLGSKETRR